MQNVLRSLCLAIGLFAVAVPAQAIDLSPYAGAGVGSFIIDAGGGSKSAFGGYGMVGADFTPNIGAEVRFGGSGQTTGAMVVPSGNLCIAVATSCIPTILTAPSPAKAQVNWFVAYLLKLQYPITPLFNVYGVVGGTTLKTTFNFIPPYTGGITTFNKTYTTLSYGGGFDYGLGNQWRVGMDATIYSNKATTTAGATFSGLDVWGITATARYGF